MKTKEGAVIVVDGGRDVDAPHLIEVIQELGGHVDAWLFNPSAQRSCGGDHGDFKHGSDADLDR